MTSDRHERVERLAAAARSRSDAKSKAVDKAIRRLVKDGRAINFRTVADAAGVSHTFLYQHPDFRSRIERLRLQSTSGRATAAAAKSDTNLVTVLNARLNDLRKAHEREVADLRRALEKAHGENLALRRRLARETPVD